MKARALLRKILALNGRDAWALASAAMALANVRVRLRVLPFPRVLSWADVSVGPHASSPAPLEENMEHLIHAVERVGHRLFPDNPCLTEALVVHRLLRRKGYPSELRIAVRRASQSELEAHAWVEHLGRVVVGARGLSQEHVPLPRFSLSRSAGKIPKGR